MPIALTSASSQIAELNDVIGSATHYVDANEFWFRAADVKAKKLLKVNATEGHNVLALLYSLAGDAQKARYHIDCALNLAPSAILHCNKATILSNLGYFSEALTSFEKGAMPEYGEFTSRWRVGLMGGFRTLARYAEAAQKMQLENIENVDVQLIFRIVQFLERHSIADRAIVEMLDVAGELLRENRMFFMGPGPEFSIWDEDAVEPHIAIIFRIPAPSVTALSIDEELGHRLFAGVPEVPVDVMLNFESGLPSNERFVERPTLSS